MNPAPVARAVVRVVTVQVLNFKLKAKHVEIPNFNFKAKHVEMLNFKIKHVEMFEFQNHIQTCRNVEFQFLRNVEFQTKSGKADALNIPERVKAV